MNKKYEYNPKLVHSSEMPVVVGTAEKLLNFIFTTAATDKISCSDLTNSIIIATAQFLIKTSGCLSDEQRQEVFEQYIDHLSRNIKLFVEEDKEDVSKN